MVNITNQYCLDIYIDGKFYGVNKYISEYSAIDVFSSSFREC